MSDDLIKRLRHKNCCQTTCQCDEAADRIEQLERELVVAIEVVAESGRKRGEAEAKLAKAVAMFKAIEMWDAARGSPMPYRVRDPMRTALAELEGKNE